MFADYADFGSPFDKLRARKCNVVISEKENDLFGK